MNHTTQLKAARRVSVPLIAIQTPDPEATIRESVATIGKENPILEWDIVSGTEGRNQAGKDQEHLFAADGYDGTKGNPVAALEAARKLPKKSALFVHLAPRWLNDPTFVQAVWNLRDLFKKDSRTLILLGCEFTLPAELQDDVIVIDEPLPDSEKLDQIVRSVHGDAGVDCGPTEKPVEAVRGLSAFAAEQTVAMCLTKSGVDLDSLWERKRKQIEQTPGLKVFRDSQTFDDIGGCDVVKGFLKRVMTGHDRPNAVVFIDEIEKAMGGTGDTSGVSQDQLGAILSYMQDNASVGMIFIGPPGAAKSAVAKAAGNEGDIPTIQLDLGGCKGSLVGQSEQQLRTALKVITAVSNGKALWIATCNSIGDLPPELRRRFTLGSYFFDLPTAEERRSIWEIYRAKYGLSDHTTPKDAGWTGAEIKQCCDIAWRLGVSLSEASAFVVPVSISAADRINALRKQSEGKFLSASRPGVYRLAGEEKEELVAADSRKIQLED